MANNKNNETPGPNNPMEQNLQHAHHTAATAIPILLNKLIPKHPIDELHQHPQRPTNPIPLTSQIDPLVDLIQF